MSPSANRGGSDPEPRTNPDVSDLSYTDAGAELDGIVEELESGVVDVDRLVEQLERATSIVDELDRRLRRTRMQVEELVPRLEAIGKPEAVAAELEDLDGVPPDPTDLRSGREDAAAGEDGGLF